MRFWSLAETPSSWRSGNSPVGVFRLSSRFGNTNPCRCLKEEKSVSCFSKPSVFFILLLFSLFLLFFSFFSSSFFSSHLLPILPHTDLLENRETSSCYSISPKSALITANLLFIITVERGSHADEVHGGINQRLWHEYGLYDGHLAYFRGVGSPGFITSRGGLSERQDSDRVMYTT